MSETAIFVVNYLAWAMWIASINFLLERKLSLPVTIAVELLLFPPVFWLSSLFTAYLTMIRPLSGVLLIYLATLLLHRGTWYGKLLVVSLVMLMMILSEFLTASLTPPELFSAGLQSGDFRFPIAYYSLYFFCQAILLAALVLTGRWLKRRHAGAFGTAMPLLYLLFPITQFLLLTTWFLPITEEQMLPNPLYTLSVILFCIAADVGLAFAMNYTAKSAELRSRNRLLEEQVHSQEEYAAALRRQQDPIRTMRRDMIDRLGSIRQLLQAGQNDEAAQLASQLQQEQGHEADLVPGCGNTVVASYLYHRAAELRADGMNLELQLSLSSRLLIPNPDLICAFGNLLDNAAEACAELEDKSITLQAQYRAPYLRIDTFNPIPAAGTKKARRIPQLERGIGTEILNRLAKKYDGEFLSAPEAGEYHASLLLREVSASASDRSL